jgi:hypothetical protein
MTRRISTMPKPAPQRVLVPDAVVAARYHRTTQTIERWGRDPELDFPPVIRLRGRRYRDALALDAWDAKQRGTMGASA